MYCRKYRGSRVYPEVMIYRVIFLNLHLLTAIFNIKMIFQQTQRKQQPCLRHEIIEFMFSE